MLTDKLPEQPTNLAVAPRPIELVLAEDGLAPLTLILPPLSDLKEMRALKRINYSLKEIVALEWGNLEGIFGDELVALESKEARFHDAPTFLNRLANLAELAGDRDREESFLRRMREIVNDEFAAHRIGENLIARNLAADAEKLFSSLDLERDSFANLRLAYFQVQRQDLDAALLAVNRAISIDPLDFNARLFEGSLRLVRGEYELAIQSFRFAAEDRQTSSPLFANLALAYVYVNRPEKAFRALRRAVALDPWNENAIVLLADLAFRHRRNEEAVPALRYFVQFEQKHPSMWARLARALIEIGETHEGIGALKRQGSIENTSAVWNNLGVAYYRNRDRKKGYEAFKYAMKLAVDGFPRDLFLATRNLVSMLSEDRLYKQVLALTKAAFVDDRDEMIRRDPALSDIVVFHIHALAHIGALDEGAKVAEHLLAKQDTTPTLAAWLVTSLIANYSYEDVSRPRALALATQYDGLLNTLSAREAQRRDALANNIAFAYLEAGDVEAARRYLQKLSHAIHKEPYPTATLGLLHMRKGDVERAENLYEEAIHLARTPVDKARIRQKLNLELALRLLQSDPLRARRYLERVAAQKEGAPQLAHRAGVLLRQLPQAK